MLFSGSSFGQWNLFDPVGSRSMAMGNTGYVLTDDETALFSYMPCSIADKINLKP
jgi:hypothetical protein